MLIDEQAKMWGKDMNMVFRSILLALALIVAQPAIAEETIVFSGAPFARVLSNHEGTERAELDETQAEEYRVMIVKRDGQYFWASRENTPLMHFPVLDSGFHWFISTGSGYVKMVDVSTLPGYEDSNLIFYIEHMTDGLGTVTYWGIAQGLSP